MYCHPTPSSNTHKLSSPPTSPASPTFQRVDSIHHLASKAGVYLDGEAEAGVYLDGEAEAGVYLDREAEAGEWDHEVSQAEEGQQVVEHALHTPAQVHMSQTNLLTLSL